jgi:AcrR family transcriptional regulator
MTANRLARADRRNQILAAATEAFARNGFAATNLQQVATEAGVSRVIVYRHFASKTELYRAALERICDRLAAAVIVNDAGDYTNDSIDALLAAAIDDPAGFRLLFQHAAREPDFRAEAEKFRASMRDTARRQLDQVIDRPGWADWASTLMPQVVIDGILAWLDAGQPDGRTVGRRIRAAAAGVLEAARGG